MENNFANSPVKVEDWEADIRAYLVLLEDESLTQLDKVAVNVLIQDVAQKILNYEKKAI